MDKEIFLSGKQASKELNISMRTLYRWVEQGRLEKAPDGRYSFSSINQLKLAKHDRKENLISKKKLARVLPISEGKINKLIDQNLLKPVEETAATKNFEMDHVISLLPGELLKEIKLYPEKREFIMEDTEIALLQTYSFEGFPHYKQIGFEDTFRNNVYTKREKDGNWCAVVAGDKVPIDTFLNDYEGVNPLFSVSEEPKWSVSKNKAVHFFIPLTCTDILHLPEGADYSNASFHFGSWLFPLMEFFYTHWGVENCGVRLWRTKGDLIPDPFGENLPNGEIIVQISAKEAKKKIEDLLLFDQFRKNIDILQSFAFGGSVSISKKVFSIESDGTVQSLEDLKNLDDFPHKDIFEAQCLKDSLILNS